VPPGGIRHRIGLHPPLAAHMSLRQRRFSVPGS
jgi:hypothetical protein